MKLGRAAVTLLIGLVAAQDELKPKQCAKHGQREICKLEQTAISITDDTRELHITVKEGGRRIKCKRESATPYKNTWYVYQVQPFCSRVAISNIFVFFFLM